jgi:hypothetical protein
MTHLVRKAGLFLLCGLGGLSCFGQSSGGASGASQSGSQTSSPAAPGQTQDSTSSTADAKKKKVWTNDDVGSLDGPISVVGSKDGGKGATNGNATADPQYIADTKKQLEKLQAQLDDTKKQLVALKDFSQGKAPEPAGYPIGKGYGRVPVDQQIASLEAKKKDLEEKIGALFDDARKKGVLPGQLR